MIQEGLMVVSLSLGIAGMIIGGLSALLGIGGGVFSVPVLFFTARSTNLIQYNITHMAVSGSLLMAFLLSLSATAAHYKHGRVALKEGLLISTGNGTGALLGTVVADALDSRQLAILFGLFVLLVGLYSLYKQFRVGKEMAENEDGTDLALPKRLLYIPAGVVVGVISSLTGVGGGVLMVPLFMKLSRFSIHRAVATSSFAIIFTALAGVVGYGGSFLFSETARSMPSPSLGYLYLPFVIPLALGGLLGGYLGGKFGGKVKSSRLKLLFSTLQIAVALKILHEVLF